VDLPAVGEARVGDEPCESRAPTEERATCFEVGSDPAAAHRRIPAMKAALLPLLLLAGAEGDPPGIVSTRLEWDPGLPGSPKFATVPLLGAAPAGAVPPADGAATRFALIPLGPGMFFAAAVSPQGAPPRIWFDRDHDGDLSREEPLPLVKAGEWLDARLTVLLGIPGEEAPVAVDLRVSVAADDPVLFHWQARLHRRGSVVLGGMLRRLALRDASHRLRFDEGKKIALLLDTDGDGLLDDEEASPEWIFPGAPFRVGEEGWSFRVPDPSGASVEFTRLAKAPPPAPRPWKEVPRPETRKDPPAPPARPLADLVREFQGLPKGATGEAVWRPLKEIGMVGTEEAYAFLKSQADRGPSIAVRGYAVGSMANPAFLKKHADGIASYARSSEPWLVQQSLVTLHGIQHPLLERICGELVDSEYVAVAEGAARTIGYLDTESARKAATALLRNPRLREIRRGAYEGIRTWKGGPPAAVMAMVARDRDLARRVLALRDMFATGHPETRAVVLESAADLRGPAGSSLTQGAPNYRDTGDLRAVADILTSFPDRECAEAALALAMREKRDLGDRLLARLTAFRDREAVGAILDALRAKDEDRREFAARVLGRIPDDRVAPALVRQFRSEKSAAVAVALVESVGDRGDAGSVDVLLQAAQGPGELRAAAVRSLVRYGFGVPEARRFLLGLLDDGNPEVRVFALDAAGASGDPALAPRVLPSLDHESWMLRLAAVEALRRLRAKGGVAPLVNRLTREESERVGAAIGRALFELTGANLYSDAALWTRWWKENGASFAVPAEVPKLPDGVGGNSTGAFFGIPLETDRVIFVLDRSGSMDAPDVAAGAAPAKDGAVPARTRFQRAIAETLGAAGRLGPSTRVNVILFESSVVRWQKSLAPLDPAARTDLDRFLLKQEPGGQTNLYDALEAALDDRGVDTLVVLTDGQPNLGKYTYPDDILAAVRRRNETRRIAIHCVSLGTDSDLLRRLAAENSGQYAQR
jgi:HEAT repeat protein